MIYKDLREFIAEVEKVNLLRHIHGAHPNLEIGGITEVAARAAGMSGACCSIGLPDIRPAFAFSPIPSTRPQRAALALGIDPTLRPVEALQAWMKKRLNLKIHQPVTVKDAAFLENTDEGDAVDLAKFPVPVWHRKRRRTLHRLRQHCRHARPRYRLDQCLDLSRAGTR